MRICYICAEYAPYAKTGGLGDVAAALTGELTRAGHEVLTFIPLHGQTNLRGARVESVEPLQRLRLSVGAREFVYDVKSARRPGMPGACHLIDCAPLFDRPQMYSDAPDEYLRYLALTRAALECCQRLGFAPDIVHCNDWHTALAPLLLR